MQGIYNYIPETNNVSRVYCIAAVLYFQFVLLTYSMEQIPSLEGNWFAASQLIPSVLWNPKVPHRTHKAPATYPYPEPAQSSPHTHIPLVEDPF
jgi:hypothetical protein